MLVAMETSGAIVGALGSSGAPAISVDLQRPEHDGPSYQGDVRDVIPLRHWRIIFFVGPNCFQHMRRDHLTLEDKIQDCRAYWGGAMVLWCLATPHATTVLVEQPDTIVYDFVKLGSRTDVQVHELRTSQTGDRSDKFLRLADRKSVV